MKTLVMTLALAAAAAPGSAADKFKVTSVLMPASAATAEEASRLDPTLPLSYYPPDATEVDRVPGDVLVVMVDGFPPAELQAVNALAATNGTTRTAYVFVRAVERITGERRGSIRYQVAVARVILHEVEHVRRQSAAHDPGGWFTDAVTAEFLTGHGVGPFRTRPVASK
jgi:hypothetical protein